MGILKYYNKQKLKINLNFFGKINELKTGVKIQGRPKGGSGSGITIYPKSTAQYFKHWTEEYLELSVILNTNENNVYLKKKILWSTIYPKILANPEKFTNPEAATSDSNLTCIKTSCLLSAAWASLLTLY